VTDPDSIGQDERAGNAGPVALIADILSALLRLAQNEFLLARAEVARGLRGMVRGIGLLIVAAVLGLVALNTLAAAAFFALVALGLSPALASALVGLAILLLAYGLVRGAIALLNPKNLIPQRSLSRLRDDVETLKSMVTPDVKNELHPTAGAEPRTDRGRD
jgi:hypothetical protein